MTKPSNTPAIAFATGRSWDEWVEMLEQAGAREMPHSAIAKAALEMMPESVERAEWWAQGTAIAYEQHAGLRVPGQSCTGDFQLSTSRTITGDMDAALQAWVDLAGDREEFGGVEVEAPAATSSSEKWRYWRVPLADGTRVALNFSDKKNGKSTVGLTHTKLDSAEAIEYWKPVWKDLLAQL